MSEIIDFSGLPAGPVYPQAAALPWRRHEGVVEFLVVSTKRGTRWVIPKGLINPGETSDQAAVREAWEEAGIKGAARTPALGHYHYAKWNGRCEVDVFAMEVDGESDSFPEDAIRRKQWVSPDEARALLDEPGLRPLFDRLESLLGA